jgi:hypothetical protein
MRGRKTTASRLRSQENNLNEGPPHSGRCNLHYSIDEQSVCVAGYQLNPLDRPIIKDVSQMEILMNFKRSVQRLFVLPLVAVALATLGTLDAQER